MPPIFFRDNADYVDIPATIGGTAFPTLGGHSPIDLLLTGMSYHQHSGDPVGPPKQLKVGGVLVGPTLLPGAWTMFDGFLVPAVVEANVDGASRVAFVAPVPGPEGDAETLALAYIPANAADAGKEVMGIGAQGGDMGNILLLSGQRSGFVSPPQFWAGYPGSWYDGNNTFVFMSPTAGVDTGSFINPADFEVTDVGADSGQVDGVASVPMCRPAVWDDFTVVLTAFNLGSQPEIRFHLRVNHTTVKTLTIGAGTTTRVRTFPGSVSLQPGDLVCWLCEIPSGPIDLLTQTIAGEILWTSRAGTEAAALGGGESGGEF